MNVAYRSSCRVCQVPVDRFSASYGGSTRRLSLAHHNRAIQVPNSFNYSTFSTCRCVHVAPLSSLFCVVSAAASATRSLLSRNSSSSSSASSSASPTQQESQSVKRRSLVASSLPIWLAHPMPLVWRQTSRSRVCGLNKPLNFARSISTTTSRSAPRISTVLQGTRFEERTRVVLQTHLSMALVRVGGRADGGIDLMGDWWLPPMSAPPQDSEKILHFASSEDSICKQDHLPNSSASSAIPTLETGWPEDPIRRRLRIYVQCKAEAEKLGPKYVREMEGVVLALQHASRVTSGNNKPDVIDEVVAVLSSESSFTRGSIERARSSSVPTVLLHLPPPVHRDEECLGSATTAAHANSSVIGGCLWNPALIRLLGSAFEVRWERPVSGEALCVGRPGLWWNGRKLRSWSPAAHAGYNKV